MDLIKWLDEKLVPDWRRSWQWFSVQSELVAGSMAAVIAGYPDILPQLAALMGGTPRLQAVVVAFVLITLVLRLWNQQETKDEQAEETE